MLEGFIPKCSYVDGAHWYITILLSIFFWISVVETAKSGLRDIMYIFLLALCVILKNTVYAGYLATFFAADYLGLVVFIAETKHLIYDKRVNCFQVCCIVSSIFYMKDTFDIKAMLYAGVLFLLFQLCLDKKIKFLEHTLFKRIGHISYSYYLIHQNIAYMFLNELAVLHGKQEAYFPVLVGLSIIPIAIIINWLANIIRMSIKGRMSIGIGCIF